MRYKVSQLAKLLGVSTNTIRRYEAEGFFTSRRDESGYRWYSEEDISRASVIRLYTKCGFSLDEIKSMLGNNTDSILEICLKRLDEMDREMHRLKYLRHWLKDDITMRRTAEAMKEGGKALEKYLRGPMREQDGYIIMPCMDLLYVICSKGSKIYSEKGRLETINKFMYDMPEVKLFTIYKHEDIKKGQLVPYNGWSIKVMDFKRWDMDPKPFTANPYVESYPCKDSLYGIIEISSDDNQEHFRQIHFEYYKKAMDYMKSHNMSPDGDIMEIVVNVLGSTKSVLVCMPFKKI